MRILISNDDGIDAEGIRVAEQIALSLSGDVYVVAPAVQQSGQGHAFSVDHAVNVYKRDERHYAVGGTPTDCVLYACRELLKDSLPDLVLSGVNIGGNFGWDVSYSGTAGAAIEGTLQGVKSVAMSLHVSDFAAKPAWDVPLTHAPAIIEKLYAAKWRAHTFININFPECSPDETAGVRVTPLSECKIGNTLHTQKNYAGYPYFWIDPSRQVDPRETGTDYCDVRAKNAIAVTPVTTEWTDFETLETLKTLF